MGNKTGVRGHHPEAKCSGIVNSEQKILPQESEQMCQALWAFLVSALHPGGRWRQMEGDGAFHLPPPPHQPGAWFQQSLDWQMPQVF